MSTFNQSLRMLYQFWMYCLHPIKSLQELDHLPLSHHGVSDRFTFRLHLYESVSLSWLALMLGSLIRLSLIMFFLLMVSMQAPESLQSVISFSNSSETYSLIILSLLIDILFYPIWTLVSVHFWEFVMILYFKLLGVMRSEVIIRDILSVHLSSRLLGVIPFVGEFLSWVLGWFYLYQGLRLRGHMTRGVSIVVLLTPLLFMSMLGAFLFVIIIGLSQL